MPLNRHFTSTKSGPGFRLKSALTEIFVTCFIPKKCNSSIVLHVTYDGLSNGNILHLEYRALEYLIIKMSNLRNLLCIEEKIVMFTNHHGSLFKVLATIFNVQQISVNNSTLLFKKTQYLSIIWGRISSRIGGFFVVLD